LKGAKMSEQTKYPEMKFRSRNVSASIWPNEIETKEGTRITKNVQIQKSYKKDPTSKEWTNLSISFFVDELADLRLVLEESFKYCRLKEQSED
jgi:hypothetical protein